MRGVGLERQVAKFIDDQQLGLGVVGQLLLEPPFAMGLRQLRDQRRRRREQDRVAGDDGFAPECDRQMGLAHARRAQEQHRLAIGDEAPRRDLADLRLVEGRLGPEVEAAKVAHERESRQAEGHVDPALVAACDLALAKQRQRLPDREFAATGLVDQAVELIAQRRQLQPAEQGSQVIMVVHQKPPPTTASYSASGRSNAAGAGGGLGGAR